MSRNDDSRKIDTMRILRPATAALALIALGCGDDGVGPEPTPCGSDVILTPGGVQVSQVRDAECSLVLPAGAPGDRYRLAVVRTDSSRAADVQQVTVSVEGRGVQASPPSLVRPADRRVLPPPAERQLAAAMRSASATARHHTRLRAVERRTVEAVGLDHVLSEPAGVPARVAAAPAEYRYDVQTACDVSRNERVATLLGQNAVLAIYQNREQANAARIAPTTVDRMLDFFENHGAGVVEAYFGTIPDVDGNGQILAVIDEEAFSEFTVVAFTWAGNFFERDECPASDEAEIIYFNPTRVRSMESADPEFIALGVLSHESKHIVSTWERLQRSLDENSNVFLSHPLFLEEGLAELADEVTSRRAWAAAGGPSPVARVTGAEILGLGVQDGVIQPEAFGTVLQMFRAILYLPSQPNGLMIVPNGAIEGSNIRDPGSHFARWLADGYGNAGSSVGADAPLFRRLTDRDTPGGTEGLRRELGVDFTQLFEQYVAAIMAHGMPVPSARDFALYDFQTASDIFSSNSQPPGVYPWPVTRVGSASGADADIVRSFETATYAGPIGPTGIRIHDFESNGTGEGAFVTVTTGAGDYEVIVVRIR